MYLEIITPEEVLFKGQISSVQLPGKDGLFQILERSRPDPFLVCVQVQ